MAEHTESFDTADSGTLGPDQSWTELFGDYSIVSNAAQSHNSNAVATARCDADLASADHDVEFDLTVTLVGTDGAGPIARKDSSSTRTYYELFWNLNGIHIYSVVAGSYTLIAGPTSQTLNAGDTVTLRCDGTTISARVNDVEIVSTTNSAISSGTRGGMEFWIANGRADNYRQADLAAAVGAVYRHTLTPFHRHNLTR